MGRKISASRIVMPDFLVTLKYNPGIPRSYLVENVATHDAARLKVYNILFYDPGVPVEVTQTPITKNEARQYPNLGGHNE